MATSQTEYCYSHERPTKKRKQTHLLATGLEIPHAEEHATLFCVDEPAQWPSKVVDDGSNDSLTPPAACFSTTSSETERRETPCDTKSQTVCMGTIYVEAVTMCGPNALERNCYLSWDLGKSLTLQQDQMSCSFELSERHVWIVQTLHRKAAVELEFHLAPAPEAKNRVRDLTKFHGLNARIGINVYGNSKLASAIGEFLQKHTLYLQEPIQCTKDLEYKNPHCLPPLTATPITTFMLKSRDEKQAESFACEQLELFAELGSDEVFKEAPQPKLVSTPLYSHQRRALTFMLGREQGWDLSDERKDVWRKYKTLFGVTRYQNNLSKTTQADPPAVFRGGILADDMGIGKTLTMLSLIASEQASMEHCCETTFRCPEVTSPMKGTLIVVPLSLLPVWELQIKEHLNPILKHLVYYKIDMRKVKVDLCHYDIVITTYNVLASEWKAHTSASEAKLFARPWHRLVLDEAHMIRAKNTRNSRSACAVEATHRWCITGTPLQNRLTDISTLLKFLRADPYDKAKNFEADIVRPWKDSLCEKPLFKLQSLMKMLALRRSKGTIHLPERRDITNQVAFSMGETELYERTKQGTLKMIDQEISSGATTGSSYLSTFQRINGLRSICNHGTRYQEHSSRTLWRHHSNACRFEDKIDHLLDNVDQACLGCGTDIEQELEDSRAMLEPANIDIDGTLRMCRSCMLNETLSGSASPQPPPSPTSASSEFKKVDTDFPSKIQAVVMQLKEVPAADKCIIFSFWTSTLDIIQEALNHADISHCRYDGKLTHAMRKEVLSRFKTSSDTKAMLISITCGGQGLDLTVANHAFLVEPQWNPMIEEQAISRIWRLRQEKTVHITRFVMKDSWEEKVMTKQERKRALADFVLGTKDLKAGTDGKKQLAHLRELVSL